MKQSILMLIFVSLTLNIIAITGISSFLLWNSQKLDNDYETIDCADGAGRVRKCIRIEPSAGEVNIELNGASYRVIFGH